MSQQQSQPLLAMVALNTPELPSPAVLIGTFTTFAGITVDLQSLHSRAGNMVFDVGHAKAAIALTPAPIPWSHLEGVCATAYWWPEAADKMRGHTSRVLVALVGDHGDLIQRCITLTHLTAAIASRTDAAGVYWGGGTLVHDPKCFIEKAGDISPDDLPLSLWIDFRLEQNEDGSYRLFTTGMKVFDCKEIEIVRSTKPPAEILAFAHSIADYVITSRKAISDGSTVGRSADEKVLVQYASSMLDAHQTVMQLDF